MKSARSAALAFALVFGAGCFNSVVEEPPPDAGSTPSDASVLDAGAADAGRTDAGGEADASVPDASAGDTDGGPLTDAGVSDDAGGPADAGAPDAGLPDAGPDLVLYGPLPYRSRADSPFAGLAFASYEHFEDVEDHLLSVPGVYTSAFPTSTLYAQIYIDSVDGDDGRVDGACSTCDSLFTPNGVQGATFNFDLATLGALPTHVGIAWTDGVGATVTVTFYGPGGTLIGSVQGTSLGDGTYTSSFAEDRFFGAYHRAGISRVVLQDPGAGIDMDHLFYAR